MPRQINYNKNAFTVGEAASIFSVSPKTIKNWINTSAIRGYKLPNSTHYRVPKESVVEFMISRDMVVPAELRPNIPPSDIPRETENWMLYLASLNKDDLFATAKSAIERLIQENKVTYQLGKGLCWQFTGEPLYSELGVDK
jgi:excisionase family DNA binding protein